MSGVVVSPGLQCFATTMRPDRSGGHLFSRVVGEEDTTNTWVFAVHRGIQAAGFDGQQETKYRKHEREIDEKTATDNALPPDSCSRSEFWFPATLSCIHCGVRLDVWVL